MKKSHFSEEQIIEVLQEAEAVGKVSDVCRKHGISDTTFYAWRSRYGQLDRRLRELEVENNRLRRLVADQALEIQMLKDASGKCEQLP